MSEAVRQRYKLATGQGLDSAPSKAGSPGFAKGGRVPSKSPMKGSKNGKSRPKGC